MDVEHLDHLVLTVANIHATCTFYQEILGMTPVVFGEDRQALCFGSQKINLHPAARPFEPKAARPTPGSADLCFLSSQPLDQWILHLQENGIVIEEGPLGRTGATGPLRSIYFRDPDGNLIEVANRDEP